jgi:hypothetical protein
MGNSTPPPTPRFSAVADQQHVGDGLANKRLQDRSAEQAVGGIRSLVAVGVKRHEVVSQAGSGHSDQRHADEAHLPGPLQELDAARNQSCGPSQVQRLVQGSRCAADVKVA